MAAKPRPTARRIELGHELRQLRQRAGVTLDEAVRGMPFSETKLQRVETGLQDLRSAGDLRKVLARYGVTDEESVERLVEIQREASRQDWWTPLASVMPSGMPRFVGIESEAQSIRVFHPTLVCGLLQTESYARAVFETAKPIEETTSEFVQQGIQLRMKRKDVLTREDEPVRLSVILYEPALRYAVGGPAVMCEQYDEILRLAKFDHVTVQVLPQSVRGYLSPHDFTLLDLGAELPSMVQVDNAWGAASVTDKPRDVGTFLRKYEALSRSALPAEDTPEVLEALSREITT